MNPSYLYNEISYTGKMASLYEMTPSLIISMAMNSLF